MNWLAIIIITIVTIIVIVFLTIAIIQINEYYNWVQIEYGGCKELKKKIDELQLELYRSQAYNIMADVTALSKRIQQLDTKIEEMEKRYSNEKIEKTDFQIY